MTWKQAPACVWICSGSCNTVQEIKLNKRFEQSALVVGLASLVTLVMLVWTGHSLARVSWTVMSREDVVIPSILTSSLAEVDRIPVTFDLETVLQAFGLFAAEGLISDLAAGTMIAANDTRLELSLRGAIPAADPGQSRAIIATRNLQRVYRVGDVLEGTEAGVRLNAVFRDYVILDNNGREERLRMFDSLEEISGLSRITSNLVNQSSASSSALLLVSDENTSMPTLLNNVLRLQLYQQEGVVSGIQIRHGSRSDLLSAAGLRVGDLITAMDTTPVSDITQLPALIGRLESGQTVSLQVQREDVSLTVSLNRAALGLP